MKIFLDVNFPSLNEYIKADRSNRYAGAAMKKKYTGIVQLLVRNCKLEPIKYDVAFTWIKPNNRKDHDNISFAQKFVLDGFVKSGVLSNDNSKHINSLHHHFEVDKNRTGVGCWVEFIPSL